MLNPATRAMIEKHMADICTVFAEPLAARLGRTPEEIRKDGLQVGDFRVNERVDITLPDGSSMRLRYAFVIFGEGIVGAFSEHSGYLCLPMVDLKVTELRDGKVVARHAW